MSIPVDLADLDAQLARFGPAYLLTTSGAKVKTVAVRPVLDGGVLVVAAPGRGSLANAADHPDVTLLWAPTEASEPAEFSLIVDGRAEVVGEDVRVTPTWAVLHKPAGSDHGPAVPGGCG